MIAVFGYGVIGKAFVIATAKRAAEANIPIPQGPFTLIDPAKDLKPIPEEIARASLAFVCVPTPTEPDGRQDLSAVFDSMRTMLRCGFNGLVVLRSTITPSNVRMLQRIYQLRIAALPEFLTEANAVQDAYEADYYVVGAAEADQSDLLNFLKKLWPENGGKFFHYVAPAKKRRYFYTTPAGAMLIKYWVNCCLASRVALANEFKLYWDQVGDGHWDKVSEGFTLDPRCGGTHMRVPGLDGKAGFGGKCFPKDVAAMALDITAHIEKWGGGALEGALEVNERVRSEKGTES